MTARPVVYTAPKQVIRPGRDYNIAVADSAPKPLSEEKHRHRHHAYAAEATGLLLMGILLLILTLARYWSYINWSIR